MMYRWSQHCQLAHCWVTVVQPPSCQMRQPGLQSCPRYGSGKAASYVETAPGMDPAAMSSCATEVTGSWS